MTIREHNHGKANLTPSGSIEHLFDKTFYLTKINEQYRRFYSMKEGGKTLVLEAGKGL